MEFKIREIKRNENSAFLINGQEFTEEKFSKSFIPSFRLTVYSSLYNGDSNAFFSGVPAHFFMVFPHLPNSKNSLPVS